MIWNDLWTLLASIACRRWECFLLLLLWLHCPRVNHLISSSSPQVSHSFIYGILCVTVCVFVGQRRENTCVHAFKFHPLKKIKIKFGFINVLKQPHGALSPDDCTDEPQLGSLVLFDVRLNAYSEKEKLCYRDFSQTARSSNSLNTFLISRIELLDLTSIHLGVLLPMKL